MPEIPGNGHQRWFLVRWPRSLQLSDAWAEKFFDNHADAFDYFEKRRAEHPTGRAHPPLPSHEDEHVWAVCVDPV
jgi:hypothetical protein